jgi:hypothetical protein
MYREVNLLFQLNSILPSEKAPSLYMQVADMEEHTSLLQLTHEKCFYCTFSSSS